MQESYNDDQKRKVGPKLKKLEGYLPAGEHGEFAIKKSA